MPAFQALGFRVQIHAYIHAYALSLFSWVAFVYALHFWIQNVKGLGWLSAHHL